MFSTETNTTSATRIRTGLPTLDIPNFAGCLHDHAMTDLVQTRLELPISFQNEQAVADFKELIADPTGPQGEPLFKLPRARRGHAKEFVIADGWHFKGKATLRLNASHRGLFLIDVSLNPTRWVNYLSPGTDLEQLRVADASDLLRLPHERRTHGSLDGNDNLLGGADRLSKLRAFPALAGVYLDAIQRLFTERLVPDQFSTIAGVTISRPRLVSAGHAEIYQEFYAPHAISAVETLRDMCIALAADVEWRTYVGRQVDGALARNCPSITLHITKDIDIAIYAKTMQRVRFEVRYRSDVSEHANHRNQRGQPSTLATLLQGLRPDAMAKLNRLLRGLKMYANTSNERASIFDVVDAAYRATGMDARRARDLMDALGNLGGVTETGPTGIAPPSVVRALVQAGVLTRQALRHGNADRAGRRFALTPRFAPLAPAMIAAANGTSETVH